MTLGGIFLSVRLVAYKTTVHEEQFVFLAACVHTTCMGALNQLSESREDLTDYQVIEFFSRLDELALGPIEADEPGSLCVNIWKLRSTTNQSVVIWSAGTTETNLG